MTGLRIAQVANFVGPTSGGMRTALHALGSGYAAGGARRLLVTPGERDSRTETPAGTVVTLRAPLVAGGYRVILEPWRVTEVLEDFGPTSLEVSDKSTMLPVARWAARRGVGALLFSHERLDAMLRLRTGRGLGTPVALLNRVLVRAFDAVVVTSRFARREFGTLAAAVGTPVHRIPLGVDLDTFRPPPPGHHTGPLRLTHLGRLSREKSPRLAVETALELHRRGVPLRMDVYGDGPQRTELEQLAAGAPVHFHGHVARPAEVARRLANADVALSVCPGETFGLAVLEALACGVPVVTADRGGARELVCAASGGWAAPDPRSLADAVLDVASRAAPDRRDAARRRAERYPWSAAVAALLAVHADLSGSPRAKARSA